MTLPVQCGAHLPPHLPGERTRGKEVVYGLRLLVAQEAAVLGVEAVPSPSGGVV
jgi:hypothetical protein